MINFKILTLFSLALCFFSCTSKGSFLSFFPNKNEIPDSDQLVMTVMDKAAREIVAKYNVHPIGFGISKPEKFKGLSIEFQVFRKLSREEVRGMLVDSAEIFIKNINENPDLQPLLENFPRSRENVGIAFYIEGGKGEEVVHPDVCVARWHSKGLYFHTDDPVTGRFKETYEETHEEALELVNQYRGSQIAQQDEKIASFIMKDLKRNVNY